MMNAEQHRRLIGNDIAVIYFHEGPPFVLEEHDNLGTVPQVFVVVSPYQDRFRFHFLLIFLKFQNRVGSYSRINIRSFGPPIPEENIFEGNLLKDFILTKGR